MDMEQQLYLAEPFLSVFTAVVTGCEEQGSGWVVQLDRTAFFPEGGGQPCDLGLLETEDITAKILDVKERSGAVCHLTDCPLPVGASVTGRVDWKRRIDHMEQHTGEHILSGILHTLYGAENVGFSIAADHVRMDMSVELNREQLAEAERRANEVIRADLPIKVLYPTPEELDEMVYRSKKALSGQVRIISIPEADTCACCGTHMARTGQVGQIKIVSFQSYKGGTRIMAAFGERAVKLTIQEHQVLTTVSQALSSKPLEVQQQIQRLMAENAALKSAKAEIEQLWFQQMLLQLPENEPALLAVPPLSGDGIRKLCLMASQKANHLTVVLSPNNQNSLSYAISYPGNDARKICKELNSQFAGRGGGKPELCQGSFNQSDAETIMNYLSQQYHKK